MEDKRRIENSSRGVKSKRIQSVSSSFLIGLKICFALNLVLSVLYILYI